MLKMGGSCNITWLHQVKMRLLTVFVNCRWTACGWRTVISSLQHRCERKWSNVWKNKEYWWRLRGETLDPNAGLVILMPGNIPPAAGTAVTFLVFVDKKNIFLTWRCKRRWRQHTRCQFLHKCLIWGSHLDANTVSSRSEVEGVTVSAASFFPFLSSCFTPPPIPQDLLVHYTRALLFNMSWKHTWVSSITHFLCCTLFLCNTAVCACVWHSEKTRNYSLVASFCLPPHPHAQQLGGKCRIAN